MKEAITRYYRLDGLPYKTEESRGVIEAFILLPEKGWKTCPLADLLVEGVPLTSDEANQLISEIEE